MDMGRLLSKHRLKLHIILGILTMTISWTLMCVMAFLVPQFAAYPWLRIGMLVVAFPGWMYALNELPKRYHLHENCLVEYGWSGRRNAYFFSNMSRFRKQKTGLRSYQYLIQIDPGDVPGYRWVPLIDSSFTNTKNLDVFLRTKLPEDVPGYAFQ